LSRSLPSQFFPWSHLWVGLSFAEVLDAVVPAELHVLIDEITCQWQ